MAVVIALGQMLIAGGLAIGLGLSLQHALPDWLAAAAGLIVLPVLLVGLQRLLLVVLPLRAGCVVPGTRAELAWCVSMLATIIWAAPLLRATWMPLPLLRLVQIGLGAQLGAGTWCSGVILDPSLVRVGRGSQLGLDCLILAHLAERDSFTLAPVVIGDRVTVGARAVILPGCTIGDGAIVGAGALVTKHTVIGAGEIWGGVPARLLRPTQEGDTCPH